MEEEASRSSSQERKKAGQEQQRAVRPKGKEAFNSDIREENEGKKSGHNMDNIPFMFCLRFSLKIFKTITNINSISYNFLFFHIFFNLSNLLTKQKLHMVEKIKIKREASLLFF